MVSLQLIQSVLRQKAFKPVGLLFKLVSKHPSYGDSVPKKKSPLRSIIFAVKFVLIWKLNFSELVSIISFSQPGVSVITVLLFEMCLCPSNTLLH